MSGTSVTLARAVAQRNALLEERRLLVHRDGKRARQHHTLLELHAKLLADYHEVVTERDNLEVRVRQLTADAGGLEAVPEDSLTGDAWEMDALRRQAE